MRLFWCIFQHLFTFFIIFTMFYILTKAWTNYYINVYNLNFFYHKTLEQNLKIQLFFFNFNYYHTHVIFVQPRQDNQHACHDWSLTTKCRRPINTLVPFYIILYSFNKPATRTYLIKWIYFCLIRLIHVHVWRT